MRPRPITLAFYIYTLLVLVKVNQSVLDLARWPINLASDLVVQIVYPLTQITLLVFAQRLYGRKGKAWPWFFGASIVLSVLVFVVWVDPIVWLVFQKFQMPGPTRLLMSGSDALLLVSVICGLAYVASGARALDRRRVAWVIAGIALAPILDLLWAVSDVLSAITGDASVALLALEAWTDALQPWFAVIGSSFVLYGFLSQRVIDFRFVIGRAVLYGATTVVLVLFFGVIEWWAEQLFESTRPALYVSLAAALIIGFSLKSIHERVENLLKPYLLPPAALLRGNFAARRAGAGQYLVGKNARRISDRRAGARLAVIIERSILSDIRRYAIRAARRPWVERYRGAARRRRGSDHRRVASGPWFDRV